MSKALRILICMTAIMLGSACTGNMPAQEPANLTGDQLIQRVEPSVVLVLVGDGHGHVAAAGSGLAVGSNGALLVPYHLVKDLLSTGLC